jgi:hypothetical protein
MLPQAVDTPIFERAANYAGRKVRPVPPLFDGDEVAAGIVACARNPKREVTYGRAGRMLELLQTVAPGLHARLLPSAFEAGNYGDEPAPPTPGAVLHPVAASERVDGGWRRDRRRDLARALLAAARGLARGLVRGR